MMPLFRPMMAACVRSLASSFDKNALDSALDGIFSHTELIGNLLVRVPGGDEAQHDHFGRCQGLIADMLGDLERDLWRQTPFAGMDRSDRVQQI